MVFDDKDRALPLGRSFLWLTGVCNTSAALPPDAVKELLLLELDSEIEALEAALKKVKAQRAIVAGQPKRKR